MRFEISRVGMLRGDLRPPSDKSLTHRAAMMAALADGPCRIHQPLRSEDCLRTLHCLEQMGLQSEWESENELVLKPAMPWAAPAEPLNCGNSGTTARLLAGLVASRPIRATMTGDPSLSRRPMRRIADPLRLMGAQIVGDRMPLTIIGGNLRGIEYTSPVASAQIKSCVLLAGLRASSETWVTEPTKSRDHTERMLEALGAKLLIDPANPLKVGIRPTERLSAFDMLIPADISSAAFFMVAATLLADSEIHLREIGVNPTRTGVIDVLNAANAEVVWVHENAYHGEPMFDLTVRGAKHLQAFEIAGALVPRLIDEIPVLAVLATQCDGVSIIRDARELRVKESDRIDVVAQGLKAMGANVEPSDDGLIIKGPTPLKGATIDAQGDHRIAMSFAIAGLIAEGSTVILGADTIATSYPGFEADLRRLCVL